ncbi:MAG: malto-oligosyltrehalose synthase [Candidatus Binatia bacterium]
MEEKHLRDSLPSVFRERSDPLQARFPLATYRLQFNRSFTFADATRVVPYLHALGISDCYASPYFNACPGSPHGYDVIDHSTLNPEVGSEEDYLAFAQELRRHAMGQLLDMVPNHMGIAKELNPWWADVLENGPSSLYASCFDIDWAPVKNDLANKVLLPILGNQYGQVLENQELTLLYEEGAFFLRYFDHRLPIAPRSSIPILSHRLGSLQLTLGGEHPHFLELQSIITALTHLPLRTETDRDKVIERNREKEIIKRRLVALTTTCPEIHTFIHENVHFFNGVKGDPRSFDPLDALLADQGYRLAYWRVAAEEINYRRFFDINELAAIRTEDRTVFAATHQLVLRLVADGIVTGLRIDHVDGLYDPAGYLRRLQQAAAIALRTPGQSPPTVSPFPTDQLLAQLSGEPPPLPATLPCYTVVEKILEAHEPLPEHWPVHGTSGYDFLGLLNGIFVDQSKERRLTEIYTRFTRQREDFLDLVYRSKKLIMEVSLSSEINVLAYQLDRLSEKNRHSRDFTLNSLTHAIREIIACFPVYRTYIDEHGVTERDRTIVETAVARAKRRNPATDVSIFNFVRDMLLLRYPDGTSPEDREAQRTFGMKFQQCTSPVMAKGMEDTAFYIYNRLVSLNEVGGAPERFGTSLVTFHQHNHERQQKWPHALLATSTHDTKRSEDVRARINVLSEIPDEWQAALRRWGADNRKKKTVIDGQRFPDRNEEYLLYQSVLGVWPLTPMSPEEQATFKQRIQHYMSKATREAKIHTSWINPNQAYDEAVQTFVGAVIDDFLGRQDFQVLQHCVARYGIYNALSQLLLKLTVPGVPDIYQGNELWDLSLVDPDNRRPVDYAQRERLLHSLQERLSSDTATRLDLVRELLQTWEDGRIKLYITWQTLQYRQAHPQLFLSGTYDPVSVTGAKAAHVCAFLRTVGEQQIVVAVPRLLTQVIPDEQQFPLGPEVWTDTALILPDDTPNQDYFNVFTGEPVRIDAHDGKPSLLAGDVFSEFPVALLQRR